MIIKNLKIKVFSFYLAPSSDKNNTIVIQNWKLLSPNFAPRISPTENPQSLLLAVHVRLDHKFALQQPGRIVERLPPVRRGQGRPQLQVLFRQDSPEFRNSERYLPPTVNNLQHDPLLLVRRAYLRRLGGKRKCRFPESNRYRKKLNIRSAVAKCCKVCFESRNISNELMKTRVST